MLAALLTIAALFAATLSGMTGMGGGTLLIGVLYAVGFAPQMAVPLHAGVQLVANGSRTLAYLRDVDWRGTGLFMLGAAPAPFVVAPLVAQADADWVRLVMAVFIVMALWPGWLLRLRLNGPVGLVFAGIIAGGVGMLLGATGLLVAPFFLREDWRRQTIIATMAVCQSVAYVVKIAAFWTIGDGLFAHLHLLVPMALAAVAGTLLGRRLHGVFDERSFRWVFRALIVLLAVKLAWDGAGAIWSGA